MVTRLAQVMETNRWKQIVGKEVSESAYVKPFQLREGYAKVLPLITVKEGANMPQTEELEKINRRLLDVQTENIVLMREIETLKTALGDMRQILEVQQKTIGHLSEALGKAKVKA